MGRWRCENETNKGTTPEFREFMFETRQNHLNEWGVTDVVLSALAASGLETVPYGNEAIDEALRLGAVLLENGNKNVQKRLYELYTDATDTVRIQKFFQAMRDGFHVALDVLEDQRNIAKALEEEGYQEEEEMQVNFDVSSCAHILHVTMRFF